MSVALAEGRLWGLPHDRDYDRDSVRRGAPLGTVPGHHKLCGQPAGTRAAPSPSPLHGPTPRSLSRPPPQGPPRPQTGRSESSPSCSWGQCEEGLLSTRLGHRAGGKASSKVAPGALATQAIQPAVPNMPPPPGLPRAGSESPPTPGFRMCKHLTGQRPCWQAAFHITTCLFQIKGRKHAEPAALSLCSGPTTCRAGPLPVVSSWAPLLLSGAGTAWRGPMGSRGFWQSRPGRRCEPFGDLPRGGSSTGREQS